jgi:two-component system chemotaxis response regulator CheB
MGEIRVLIVDDSAFMRHALGRLLTEEPDIEVVGAASNGDEGLRMAAELRPDVITLDVEMPVLDGVGMLRRLMLETPTRVVMLSSRTTENARITLEALDCGDDLVARIRAAAAMSETAFVRHRQVAAMNLTLMSSQAHQNAAAVRAAEVAGRLTPEPTAVTPPAPHPGPRLAARKLVVIASSTGGPSALSAVIKCLPAQLGAAVAIVQHMPPAFTTSLAARLGSIGLLPCSEAANEDVLVENEILVAPGDFHLICSKSGHVQLVHLPPVNGVRPAADVTLQAMAPIWRERLLCVVLTGMGCDAREGARAVKQHGGTVIAQDAATSTIYGMPAAVAQAGLTDQVLPLHQIASGIVSWCDLERWAGRATERPERSAIAK